MSTAAARKPISEKRLAANRANARKSTGPRSAAGKEKVSRNRCRLYLYARKHRASPETLERAARRTAQIALALPDPAERLHAERLIYWGTLIEDQALLEVELYNWAAARNDNDWRRAFHWLCTAQASLFSAVQARSRSLSRHFEKALRAHQSHQPAAANPLLAALDNAFPVRTLAPKRIAGQTQSTAAAAPTSPALPAPLHPTASSPHRILADQTQFAAAAAPAHPALAAPFHPVARPAQRDLVDQTQPARAPEATQPENHNSTATHPSQTARAATQRGP